MRASHNRRLAAGLFFIYLSLSVAEDAALSEQSHDSAGVEESGAEAVTYDAIGGMMLESHGTVVKNESKDRCQLMCSESATCKSFSYSESGKVCVVSDDALTYDPAFVFEAKAAPEDLGKDNYHSFEGLTYKPQGWSKISGKSMAECRALCTKAAACLAFSYRQRDESCLLSEQGIEYSAKFTYYEKNKPSMATSAPVAEMKLGEGASKDLGASQEADGDGGDDGMAIANAQTQADANDADLKTKENQDAADNSGGDAPAPAGPLSADPAEARAQGYNQGYTEGVKASSSPKANDPLANEQLQKLERRVKYKAKQARLAIYETQETQKEGNHTVKVIQEETQKQIDALKENDKEKLKQLEADFKMKEEESFQKKKNAEQLKFAQQELRNKVQENQDALDKIKLDGLKKDDEIKEKADMKASITLQEAASAAALETKKLEVAATLKEVQEKLLSKQAESTDAKELQTKATEQTALVKELSKKHTEKITADVDAKKAAAEAQTKVDRVRTEKEAELLRVKTNEEGNKKAGALESQQQLMNTESAEKLAASAKHREEQAKAAVVRAAESRQKAETVKEASKQRQAALTAQTLEAMRQRDEVQAALKTALDKQTEEAEKTLSDATAEQKETEISDKEKANKNIIALKSQLETRERVFNGQIAKDTDNAKRQALKMAMDKAKVHISAMETKVAAYRSKIDTLRNNWYGDGSDTGGKQKALNDRDAADVKLRGDLATVKNSKTTTVNDAKAMAAEVTAKAEQNAEMTAAKAEARARMIKADALERAQKLPVTRSEMEKQEQGIIYLDLKASVAAYTDSGVDRVGVNNYNPLKDALLSAKMTRQQALLIANDADLEYDLANKKRAKLFTSLNETLTRQLAEAEKQRAADHNVSLTVLKDAESQMNGMEDITALSNRMNALTNGAFGGALNTSSLVQSEASPSGGWQTGTSMSSPAASRRLLMADGEGNVASLAEVLVVEPVSLLEETENLAAAVPAAADGKTSGGSVSQASCTPKGSAPARAKCTPGTPNEDPPSCQGPGCSISADKTHCTHPSNPSLCTLRDIPTGCFYDRTGSKAGAFPGTYQDADGTTGPTAKCNFVAQNGWTCPTVGGEVYWRLPNAAGQQNNDYLSYPGNAKFFQPCSKKSDFTNGLQTAQTEASEIHAKSVKMKGLQDVRTQAINRMNNADSTFAARETLLKENYATSVGKLDQRVLLVEAARNASSVKMANADVAFNQATVDFGNLASAQANTPFGADQTKVAILELQKASDHDRNIYLKFPTDVLKQDDTILKAHLKMYKTGGLGGSIMVHVSACGWSRNTITYTGARNLAYKRASSGTTAAITDTQNEWTNIALKGDVIERARSNGDSICLQVTGGPASGQAVFASETTAKAPELKLEVKVSTGAYNLQYGAQKNVFVQPKVDKQDMTEQELCHARIKREITKEFTDRLLRRKKKAAVKRVEEIKLEAGVDVDAEDVLSVMTMQIDAANLASANVGAEAGAIKKNIRVVVSKQLTAMANQGASADDIAIATEKLRSQAVADASQSASGAAGQIQKKTNEALLLEEKKLQDEQKRAKEEAKRKKADVMAQSKVLSPIQKAKMMVEVNAELAKRAIVCQKLKPGDLDTAQSIPAVSDESRVEAL